MQSFQSYTHQRFSSISSYIHPDNTLAPYLTYTHQSISHLSPMELPPPYSRPQHLLFHNLSRIPIVVLYTLVSFLLYDSFFNVYEIQGERLHTTARGEREENRKTSREIKDTLYTVGFSRLLLLSAAIQDIFYQCVLQFIAVKWEDGSTEMTARLDTRDKKTMSMLPYFIYLTK